MSRARVGAGLALALLATSCTPTFYVLQAAEGQLEILSERRPLDEVVDDAAIPPERREQLARIPAIKAFAVRHGLTPTESYESYVDLDRPAVVWVVSACEPLAFRSTTWTFPIAGRVPYLGWFDPVQAEAFGDGLRRRGLDVSVRTAGAYSTLGWFEDPVLSTMLDEGPGAAADLANVVLHESVHATVYVPGQSTLNESLADFVADHLTPTWLAETPDLGAAEATAWAEAQARSVERRRVLEAAYLELETLYASSGSELEKLRRKRRILDAATATVGARKPLNNATLVQFKTYNSGAAELRALLEACEGDVGRFLRAVKRLEARPGLADADHDAARAALAELAREGCASR